MIYIGADHGGVELKKVIIDYLKEKNIEYGDLGTDSEERTDYPIYAKKVCEKIIGNGYKDKGILICKSGHGMTYAANKFKGIRASLAYSEESLKNGIEDDGLNVVTIASNDTNSEEMKKYVDILLNTKFKDFDRYILRVEQVQEIEKENMK